jgi:hypothetical protein
VGLQVLLVVVPEVQVALMVQLTLDAVEVVEAHLSLLLPVVLEVPVETTVEVVEAEVPH